MRALILALLLAVPAAAPAEELPLTPEALLDRLVGGSAVFTLVPGGAHVGIEYFPARDRSFWRDATGRCTTGEVTVEEGLLCFRYEDAPAIAHCWAPFQTPEGEPRYRSAVSGEVQAIRPVPGLPFDCVDGLTS
jgi:hypothetical protein